MNQELVVDTLGGAAQRQLAQRGQVARREIVLDRPRCRLRKIDLAVMQTLDQVVRRQVDDLDIVGPVDDGIGHGLAHPDAGDLRDDVVQAFDMLDVQRGVDVDSPGKQLLDIEVALGMAAARGVGMGQFIDQDERRPPGENGIEIHLLEPAALVLDLPARNDLEALDQLLGFLAAMGLDHADHDIDAIGLPGPARDQHFIGLADARRRAEEDLQAAAILPLGTFEKSVRRRPAPGIAVVVRHQGFIFGPGRRSPSSGRPRRLRVNVGLRRRARGSRRGH